VQNPTLDVFDGLAGIALVPGPIERLGHQAELDDQVAGQVLRLDFAALFPPEAEQGGLVGAHDHAGVGAADEGTAMFLGYPPYLRFHGFLSSWK
jgi:hypothetical protein